MKKLSNQTIKENTIQHNIYNEILLDLYNKKDNLSQTEIKFVDLMKKLIEKGVIINQQGLKKMLEIKFTKEEMKDPDFLDLYENCIRKL